jgi:hypothetical protein
VAVLFMFAVQGLGMLASGAAGVVLGGSITLASALAAVAIYFLELFVAFLRRSCSCSSPPCSFPNSAIMVSTSTMRPTATSTPTRE